MEDYIKDFEDCKQIILDAVNNLNISKGLDLKCRITFAEKKATRKLGRKILFEVTYPKDTVDNLEIYEANFRRYQPLPFGDKYFSNLDPRADNMPVRDVLVLKVAAWIWGLGIDWKLF